MQRSLKAEFNVASDRDVDAFRKPPVAASTKAFDGFGRNNLYGRVQDTASARERRISAGSRMILCYVGKSVIHMPSRGTTLTSRAGGRTRFQLSLPPRRQGGHLLQTSVDIDLHERSASSGADAGRRAEC